jgi:hypothetical protein
LPQQRHRLRVSRPSAARGERHPEASPEGNFAEAPEGELRVFSGGVDLSESRRDPSQVCTGDCLIFRRTGGGRGVQGFEGAAFGVLGPERRRWARLT